MRGKKKNEKWKRKGGAFFSEKKIACFSPTKIIVCSQQIVFPYFASHVMLFQHLLTISVQKKNCRQVF